MGEKIVKNSVLILILILLGKILSFARDVITSYYFGATNISDAYFAANNIPSLLFTALISSYIVLLIPTYKRILIEEGIQNADKFGSSLINFFLVFSVLLSVLGYFLMDFLVGIVAPGFDQKMHELSVSLGKILILSFPFSSITTILATLSNANKKYFAPQVIPLFSSLFIIIGLIFFAKLYGIFALAISGVLAFIIQLLIQIVISRSHFHYYLNSSFFDRNVRRMTVLALPVLFGFAIDQINLLVNSIICSDLSVGSLSALTYAQRLQVTITGTISMAIITVVYPLLSELISTKQWDRFYQIINKSIKGILLVITPISIFMVFNAKVIIGLVYFRGSFDLHALNITSEIYVFYALNVILLSLREFLLRLFYVSDDTKTPLIASIISIGINVVLSLLLVNYLDAAGLSLANMIATIVSTFILIVVLKRKKIILISFSSIHSFLRQFLLPIAAFTVIQAWLPSMINIKSHFIFFSLFFLSSLTIYYLLLLLCKQKDVVYLTLNIKGAIAKLVKS